MLHLRTQGGVKAKASSPVSIGIPLIANAIIISPFFVYYSAAKLRFFLETTKKKPENLQAISKLRNALADKHSQLCCVSTSNQPFRAQAPLADQNSDGAIAEPATSSRS